MARIALEARSLSTRGGGVRRYTVEVIRRLLALKSPHEFHVFTDSRRHRGMFPGAQEHVVPVGHEMLRIPWDLFTLPRALRRLKPDLVHYFKPATTFLPLPRVVSTIYDVIPLIHPETQTALQRAYWRFQLPLVARRSEHILTISEQSKRDIVSVLRVPPERVTVTHLGVDAQFRPPTNEAVISLRTKLGLPEKFLLYVGTIEPRKNVARLLRAFERIMDRVPHTLLIAGKWGWKSDDVQELLRSPRLSERVRYLSYIDADTLPTLYGAADAFVFPSLSEGFGLPPLEAMACGTPVMTSSISSLPEAVGPHALLVNPEDEDSIANAMERLVTDRALHDRLQKEGIEWTRHFTWDRTAEQTLTVYNKVLAQ